MEREEEENKMDALVPCVCVVINVHYVLAHPASFSHLTSLWSSQICQYRYIASEHSLTHVYIP